MGKIPDDLRKTIAHNIRVCRMKKYPGRGGGKKCAEALGVSPQQFSPWECGKRTPDEMRLQQIAEFFNVTVEYLRTNSESYILSDNPPPQPETPQPQQHNFRHERTCPFFCVQEQSFIGEPFARCWLLGGFLAEIRDQGLKVRMSTADMDYLVRQICNQHKRTQGE